MIDAAFFIILIGIAVGVIAVTGGEEEGCDHENLSDVCDSLFSAQMKEKDFGYAEDRVMSVTDLAALSLMKDDGLLENYLKVYLDCLYPWENAYSVNIRYGTSEVRIGEMSSGFDHSLQQRYAVEYGGELTVEMFLCG